MTTEPNDQALAAALKWADIPGNKRAVAFNESIALDPWTNAGEFTDDVALRILASSIRTLDHKLEIAQRDAGTYCAANVLAAREFGIDEDELEPHMLEHQVRALKKERDALQSDKDRLDWILGNGSMLKLSNELKNLPYPKDAEDWAHLARKGIDAARAKTTKGETP